METFDFVPALGAALQVKPRVKRATFGDGYEQRVADGINTQARRWQVRFTRDTADVDDIVDFLSARGGVEAFEWTPPKGDAGVWVCREYTVVMPDSSVQEVNATFDEVFGESE